MAAPLRVLVLDERDPRHPRAGGAQVHIAQIFGRLARRGWPVTLACSRFAGGPTRERVDDMDVWRVAPLAAFYPSVALAVARETRRDRFDVVVECLNKVPFFSPLYSGVPVLALCHHLFGSVAFQQVAWPIAAAVVSAEALIPRLYRGRPFVAISESSRDDLVARGIPARDVRVSHCGAEPATCAVDPARPRPCRIAYLGRLEPYKRIEIVLEAAARLVGRFPALELLVIGQGGARAALEQRATALGLAERTHFVGFVSAERRDALLASTRVCVMPSPKEGWGLSVIEANAVGTPVVASDAPGLRDSVRHAETGFLVAGADPAAYAERIAALLADDALATAMSARALAWSRRFDWERAASEMGESLERAHERGRA
jgi:glycosyltransferase involved in cell wall biosynthesis